MSDERSDKFRAVVEKLHELVNDVDAGLYYTILELRTSLLWLVHEIDGETSHDVRDLMNDRKRHIEEIKFLKQMVEIERR